MNVGYVLLEEESALLVVQSVALRLGLEGSVQCLSFEGKADLRRSFVRKLQGIRYPADARFIVSRDNDGSNCRNLKAELLGMVPNALQGRVKLRLVMQELESWYLGDFDAIQRGGIVPAATLKRERSKARYGNPDSLTNAGELFQRLGGGEGKLASARALGPHLNPATNASISFRHFCDALRWATTER